MGAGKMIFFTMRRVNQNFFKTRKQINYFLVKVYSALFNNVTEALNLVLENYLAEIQLPGNITQLLSIPQSSSHDFQHGLPLEISFTSYEYKCCCI
jgi:hypothetical protein